MPDSIREQIKKAVKAQLEVASGKPTGLNVHRSRARPMEEDDLPALVIYPAVSDTEPDDLGLDDANDPTMEDTLKLRIEQRAKVSAAELAAGVVADEKLDELYQWVVGQIAEDRTLGGLAIDVVEGLTVWDLEERNQLFAAAATEFTITFCRAADDPTEAR